LFGVLFVGFWASNAPCVAWYINFPALTIAFKEEGMVVPNPVERGLLGFIPACATIILISVP